MAPTEPVRPYDVGVTKPQGRKLAWVLAPLALLATCGAALRLGPFRDDPGYAHAASIRATAEYQDPALMARAWELPVAARYRRGPIDSQRNVSFCGPTSVVNVLRSLDRPAEQREILDGTDLTAVFGMLPGGLTLDRLAGLAEKKTGRRVTLLRDLDLVSFRRHVAASNDPARRYIVNFHRGPLFARGGGHHSPIGGYLPEQDLVLVVDVNRDYGPWLVRTDRLFEAMDTLDPSSGRKRGLLLIE